MGLTFFYDFASSYSYLAVMRMEAAARAAGVNVAWSPFLLGPVFAELGVGPSPNLASPQRARYMWRDIARRAAQRGLAFAPPDPFPQRSVAAGRAALALAEPERPAFSRAVFAAQFVDRKDIGAAETLRMAAVAAGLDPARVAAGAASPEAKSALFATTAAAQAAGVFGAPTFVTADGEMFWGDDRLDDALEWAASVGS